MKLNLKSLLPLPLLLLLTACTASAPILIASLGITGAGLVTYCSTSGSCPPSVIVYGGLIIKEAASDAIIWESGSTTPDKVTQIISNLNADIQQGQVLTGLNPEAQTQVRAISLTLTALLPLFQALLSPPPPPPPSGTGSAPSFSAPRVIHLPPLTGKDKDALAKMWGKVTQANPAIKK